MSRLIDADVVQKRFHELYGNEYGSYELLHTIPTAYDVDEVVDQMDYIAKAYDGDECEPPKGWHCDGGTQKCCIQCCMKKAIEIVKAGGTNEDN